MHLPANIAEGLFPYQILGVQFLAARKAALLADDMGLGKSAQTVRAADAVGAKRLLIICPAVACINWTREVEKFQTISRSAGIIKGRKIPDTDVLVVSFNTMISANVLEYLMAQRFDLIVVDEAQALKAAKSKRTQAALGNRCTGDGGIISRADRTWLLSGTPAPNHVGELWPMCRALFSKAFVVDGKPMSEQAFLGRYCVTRETQYGYQVLGGKNLGELKAKLGPYMLRRRKTDVLKDLPPLRFETLAMDPSYATAALRDAEKGPEGEILKTLLSSFAVDSAPEIGAQFAETAIARLRRLTGLAKADAASALLAEELGSGALNKVVVFAYHREVIECLARNLHDHGVVQIHGGTDRNARQRAIDNFQTDPSIKVFIGQIDACNSAITLTTSSNVVFVEASWVPAVNQQAAARCHRIGARSAVLARFITLAGSLDEAVMSVVKRKTAALDAIFS